VVETISLNIGALEYSNNVKVSTQFSNKEGMKFTKLLGRFQDVFAWSYEDLRGFDPSLIQHTIPIKEGMKPARKKQRPLNSAFGVTFQRELENLLRVGIIFPVYPEWASNWVPVSKTTDHIRTCINLHTFSQAIMINHFPPLNMEMILQQVVRSQMRPLLDNFLGYSKIKEKGVDVHKTTLITNWSTVTYKCLFSALHDASTTFKRPIHTTLDELISIHIYLDDLIIYVKGVIISSEFQVLFLGPFKIALSLILTLTF
jgi:hypothetical protein